MQTVSSQTRIVTIRALRPFMVDGAVVEPGSELQVNYIDARTLEHSAKATIVADAGTEEARDPSASADASPKKKEKKDA